MPFDIRPLKEFLVRPALPAELSRMSELANNLLWSWDITIRSLFRRLDPKLWEASDRNPVLMLGEISQEALAKAAADPRYRVLYRRACERYDACMQRPDSYTNMLIAYFSMEYGCDVPADLLRWSWAALRRPPEGSSDAGIPLIGVGLLYQKGYLKQSLNPDGWQKERYPVNDFYTLPVTPVQDSDRERTEGPCETADGHRRHQGLAHVVGR